MKCEKCGCLMEPICENCKTPSPGPSFVIEVARELCRKTYPGQRHCELEDRLRDALRAYDAQREGK